MLTSREQSEAVFPGSSSQTLNWNVESNLIPDFCRESKRTQVLHNDERIPNGPQCEQAGPSQPSLTQTTLDDETSEAEFPSRSILLALLSSHKPSSDNNHCLSSLAGYRDEKIYNVYWHPDGQRAYCVTRNFAVIPQQSPSLELVKKCSDIWDDARQELQTWQKTRGEGPAPLGCFAVFNDVSQERLEWVVMDLFRGRLLEKIQDTNDFRVENSPRRYWETLERFPCHAPFVPMSAHIAFLRDMSTGLGDFTFEVDNSDFPFTEFQTQNILFVYNKLRDDIERGSVTHSPVLLWHIARTISQVERFREKKSHGPDAMLGPPNFALSLGRDIGPWFVTIVSLGAVKLYRARLSGLTPNGVVRLAAFRGVLDDFLTEWSDLNLLGTVFVGANISFLAVPNISSLEQIASLASASCALISLLTGVANNWQHRSRLHSDSKDTEIYSAWLLGNSEIGFSIIPLSIPLIAILYGIMGFFVALTSYCVRNSGTTGRILLAIVLGVSMIVSLVTALFFGRMWITSVDNPSTKEKLPKCGLRNLVADSAPSQRLLKWLQRLREAHKSEDDPEKGESRSVG